MGTYLAALRAVWQVALAGKASGSERFPRAGVLWSLGEEQDNMKAELWPATASPSKLGPLLSQDSMWPPSH